MLTGFQFGISKCGPTLKSEFVNKLGYVVRMVVDSILLHVESGPNDHRKDAPPFTLGTFKTRLH